MTIKTFSNSFQDNYFNRIPILHLVDFQRDTDSDIFVTIQHALALIQDFTVNSDFLYRESATIQEEVDTIFDALENKLDRMRSYSEAIIGLNSTFEDEFKIKNVKLYNLKTYTNQWEHFEKCLTLPMTSTYKPIKAYKTTSEGSISKNSYNFVLPTTETYKAITITKSSSATDITKILAVDSKKNILQTYVIDSNIGKEYIITTLPLGTYIVIVEALVDSSVDAVELVPLYFYHEPSSTLSLETLRYDFATYLTLQSKTDLPKDCILQLDLQLIFYDMNNNITDTANIKMSINNDGLLVDRKRHVLPTDELVYVYKDGASQDIAALNISLDHISPETYVAYRRVYTGLVEVITEDTLKFNLKNSKTFDCVPTLSMHSLTSPTLTPKLYTLTGITKNESN